MLGARRITVQRQHWRASAVDVVCNGERVTVEEDRLAAIVKALGYGDRKVVVAVNETFVAKAAWPSFRVAPDSRLDILAPMQGG